MYFTKKKNETTPPHFKELHLILNKALLTFGVVCQRYSAQNKNV